MKSNSLLKAAAALSMTVILSSCAGNQALLQLQNAVAKGKADVGVSIASQPAACDVNTPHAALTTGEDVRVLLKRERGQLDVANGKRADCYLFNKVQIDLLRGAVTPKK